MSFLNLLLAFWLNSIHPNRRFIQHLLCNQLERHYNALFQENERGAYLYSSILSNAPEIDVCPCSGMVITQFGIINVPKSSNDIHTLRRNPRKLRPVASRQLLKMLCILSMSSSILLPRLLQGIMSPSQRHTIEARIMLCMIMTLSSPIFENQSFDSIFHLFRSESPSMRPVCRVPLHHIGRALLSEDSNMRSQHWGLRMMLYAFQHANPSFPLSFEEILELIFWAFFEQDRLKKLDAALFGLPNQSRLGLSAVLNIEYTEILREANQGGLLNRAIHFSIQTKR